MMCKVLDKVGPIVSEAVGFGLINLILLPKCLLSTRHGSYIDFQEVWLSVFYAIHHFKLCLQLVNLVLLTVFF